MTKIFYENDLVKAKNQKKKCLTYFFIGTGVYLALSVFMFVFFVLEPYGSKKETPLLIGECVLTGIYVVLSYIYMTIRFSRVKNYCVMLERALTRKPSTGTATFMRFNSDITVKDRVDFKSITLVEWSEKEKEYMERYILIDPEKPRPDFRAGDEISFETYSNILVGYTINNRTSLAGTPFENA
jgi:hypothetical protein